MTFQIIFTLILVFNFIPLIAEEGDDFAQREISLASEIEPLAIVAGCVNAVTGNYFQVETDLIGNTIDPISLNRSYDSQGKMHTSLGLGFGLQFPIMASETQKSSKHSYAIISEREGQFLTFEGNKHGYGDYTVDRRILEKGSTNLGNGGKGILSNIKAHVGSDEKIDPWRIRLGDGTQRWYGQRIHLTSTQKKHLNIPTKYAFLLTQEVKPNGNVLEFQYGFREEVPYISSIRTLNRNRTRVINEVKVSELPKGFLVNSSCGNHVIYDQTPTIYSSKGRNRHKNLLTYVSTKQMGHTQYGFQTLDRSNRPYMHAVSKLGGYQQIVNFDRKNRVESLSHTVGEGDSHVITHQFAYEDYKTVVTDFLNKKIAFSFDKEKRVTEIKRGERKDTFEWCNNDSSKGWLLSKTVQGQRGEFYKKTYEYDGRGNVVVENLFGNISGESNGSHQDCLTLKHEYSFDAFNLLTKTSTSDGLHILYSYLPGTNLKTKELHYYNGFIQERLFKFYDDNGEVIETIEDDGSGEDFKDFTHVTYRTHTCVMPVHENSPAFGKPSFEEKYYISLVDFQRILLHRINYRYDEKGNCIEKTFFDRGEYSHTICKKFDDNNRVVEEIDACGHIKLYQYDLRGNRIREECLSNGKVSLYHYNSVNKLIREEVSHSDGSVLTTSYSYNPLGQKVKETDSYGNETLFEYDEYGNLTGIVYPEILTHSKVVKPKLTKTYNILGHVTSERYNRKQITLFSRNILGKPTKISYADGTQEIKLYTNSGLLKKEVLVDGSHITYEYDPKGRVKNKQTWDEKGHIVAQESCVYKGKNLLEKRDIEGHKTTYDYDFAGRLIGINYYDKATKITLDGFGRKIRVQEGERISSYTYDALDRVIAETKEDISGTVFGSEYFEYDCDGNSIEHKRQVAPDKYVSTHSEWNSDGSIKSDVNEEGLKTTWSYDRSRTNALNQKVLEITKKEPSGHVTKKLFDAHKNLVREEVYKNDVLLSSKILTYNMFNKPLQEVVEVKDGDESHPYTIDNKYDVLNRLIEQTEENHKTTRFEYDRRGRLSKKIFPDESWLAMTYDCLGNCISKTGSDGTSYKFSYDTRNNLIHSHDVAKNVSLTRKFDKYDHLIEEEFFNNLRLEFEYDAYDRLSRLKLPDSSEVRYFYDPYHLRSIQRSNQSRSYTVNCTNYDKEGRLLEYQSPITTTKYEYDVRGRTTKISSPNYSSLYEKFDESGNLLKERQIHEKSQATKEYAYDGLNYLIKENSDTYRYDSIGNCTSFNHQKQLISPLNELQETKDSQFKYDKNGRLIHQTVPESNFQYDSFSRLTNYRTSQNNYSFTYDGANRCLKIDSDTESKSLLYIGEKEIGAVIDNELREFRLTHPESNNELTFAVEIGSNTYFTQQDARHQIVKLENEKGTQNQIYNYSSFQQEYLQDPLSPWRFSNRRQVGELSLFTHRFYNPHQRRWLTPDPIGFVDSYNLYNYNQNNPHRYFDKDGRIAFALPVLVVAFNLSTATITSVALPTITATAFVAATTATILAVREIDHRYGTHLGGALFNHGCFTMNAEMTEVLETEEKFLDENDPGRLEGIVVPEDPSQLFPDKPRDRRGRILLDKFTSLRPEQHFDHEEGKKWNPRHHGPHVHVESKRDPSKSWNNEKNVYKHKPPGYNYGDGTGFVPGETLPNLTFPKG